jgi:hypothetical protein
MVQILFMTGWRMPDFRQAAAAIRSGSPAVKGQAAARLQGLKPMRAQRISSSAWRLPGCRRHRLRDAGTAFALIHGARIVSRPSYI